MTRIHNAFSKKLPAPSPLLAGTIIARVEHAAQRSMRIRAWTWRITALLSMVALVPAVIQLGYQFSQSGFYQYLSLIFSDSGSVLAALKDFGFIIAESLPVMNVLIVCCIFILFLWAAKKALEKNTYQRSRFGISF